MKIDKSSGSETGIDYAHHEIHSGDTFKVCHNDEAISDDGTIAFVLTVNTPKEAHLIYSGAAGGNASLTLYEDVTGVSGGTAMTERNKNRSFGDGGNQVAALRDPTVTLGTTIIESQIIPGGTGGNATGGTGGARDEIILSPGKVYALVLKNLAGSAKPCSLCAEWYEHALPDTPQS